MKTHIFTLSLALAIGSVAHAATLTWTNLVGGNWSVAANWNPNQVPGSADNAVITNSGTYAVTLDEDATLNSLTFGGASGQQTLTNNANTLTLNNASVVNTNSVFGLGGGRVNGILTINGRCIWTGGIMGSGSGAITFGTNATLLFDGTSGVDYPLVGNVTNAGTIYLQNGNLQIYEANLFNLPGALLDIQSDAAIDLVLNGEIENQGVVRKTGGTGTTTIWPQFDNSGTLDIQTGSVNLNGGGSDSGTILTQTGTAIIFGGGEFVLETNFYSANAILGGARLDGNGIISGLLTWTNGIIGHGNDTITLATNSTLILNGTSGTDYPMTANLTNDGTILLQSGNFQLYEATLVNRALINIQSDIAIDDTLAGPIINQGTVLKSGGTGTTTINPEFDNTGTLDIETGTVNLAGGYNLTGGTLNFGISSPTSFGNISFAGGTANLSGNLTVSLGVGFIPNDTNSFGIFSYGSESGSLTPTNLPTSNAWQVNYGSTVATLQVLNTRPVLDVGSGGTVNELGLFTATNSATDADPLQSLTFGLILAPSGMTINPATGVVTWTPAQTQSPSTNTVIVSATDNGTPALSATNSFTVIVREVNVAPTLPDIATINANELALLTITNMATESNIHSVTTGYTLVNPPAGINISAGGVITWTPTQAQSPSTNLITTIATNSNPYDLVNLVLLATNSFTVVVKEVNVAATLPVIANTNINELTMLTVTNTATESNIHSTITGYALANAPAGMNIGASGIITWTPTQAQSPSTNVINTIVANTNPYDAANSQLFSTNSFIVVVKEVNVAPVLSIIANTNVNELALLTATNAATDSNIHAVLSYALVNPPAGMTIGTNGVITWTPAQTQSPSTNLITTIVTSSDAFDLVNSNLTATNHFTVAVNEVNVAPVLPVIGTQSVNAFARLTVTNAATDSNIHAVLSYTLVNPPAGVSIGADGVITWTPEAAGTNVITTIATATDGYDLVNPALTATNSFTVIVRPVTEISGAAWLGDGQFQFSFNTVAGQDYTIEYSTNLVEWTPLLELQGDGSPFNIIDPNADNAQGFYRIASP